MVPEDSDEGRPYVTLLAARGRVVRRQLRSVAAQDEPVDRAHEPEGDDRRPRVVLVTPEDAVDGVTGQDLLGRALEQLRVEGRAEVPAGADLELEPAGEGPSRLGAQNIRPPRGTSEVGRSRTTRPSSSGTPSTSTSDLTGPI
jgi:hypothetical protein